MKKEIFRKIYKAIKNHDTIVIARHIGPDPDALSSQFALKESIRLSFPDKKVYAVGLSVSRFKYLGILDKIDDSLLIDPLLIAVDVPNIARIDGVSFDRYKNVIKIDHHPREDDMGEIEYVNEDESSTAEIILKLINNTPLKMNQNIAATIYKGLVADSDRFLVASTTPSTFEAASYLIKEYDLNIRTLYNDLYIRPLNEVRFQSFLTLNMTITENGFGYLKVTNDMIKEYKVDAASASNMINNFNFIKEIIVWSFVTYDSNQELYRINIRSRGPVINGIAANYNGGGHKFAAGARIKDEQAIDLLFQELDEACKKYNKTQEES